MSDTQPQQPLTTQLPRDLAQSLVARSPALAILVYIGWQLSTLCAHAQGWQPVITLHVEGMEHCEHRESSTPSSSLEVLRE